MGLQIGDYIGVILTRLTLTDAPVYVSACQTKLVLVFGGLHKGSGIFVQGKKNANKTVVLCWEIIRTVDLLMSLSGLPPLWLCIDVRVPKWPRQRLKSDNNSSPLMRVIWITALPPFPAAVSKPLNTSHLRPFHGGRVVAKARGDGTQRVIVYFCQSVLRGQGGRGRRGHCLVLKGSDGGGDPALLFKKFICRRDHLRLVWLWLTVLMYWLSSQAPGHLVSFTPQKKCNSSVGEEWRGGREEGSRTCKATYGQP